MDKFLFFAWVVMAVAWLALGLRIFKPFDKASSKPEVPFNATPNTVEDLTPAAPAKRGRPKGSKNKKPRARKRA